MIIKSLTRKEDVPFILLRDDDLFNSYNLCNFTLTKPETDLNKINIKVNFKKKLTTYPKRYKLQVFYEDIELKRIKTIGEGSYGKVVLYGEIIEGREKSVVVKLPIDKADPYEEPHILSNYLDKGKICHHFIVPIRTVMDDLGNPFIIMQEANNSVDKINMDPRLKIKLIIYLAKAIQCFYKNNMVYLDLKKENILYRCKRDKISFYLGDIGGFQKLGADEEKGDEIAATFTPPEFIGKYLKATKEAMLYVLGATIADIYDLADDLLTLDDNLKKVSSERMMKEKIPRFHSRVTNSNIPEPVKEIILAFTDINLRKRKKYDIKYVLDKLL